MSVILRKRKNKDGTTSLVLDIYSKGVRKREFLKHLQLTKPSNLTDRANNKEKFKQAESIAIVRASELSASDYNMVSDFSKKAIITIWMQNYIDNYKKKDKRNMIGVMERFKSFLQEQKKSNLTFDALNVILIEEFMEFLESKSKGEGALSYFNRFKKMIKQAYRQKLLKSNPVFEVDKKIKGEAKRKDTLTIEELQLLSSTEILNPEIKRAFLFSALTGCRWIDVKTILRWKHIRWQENKIIFNQSKTGKEVVIPMNESIIKLLGESGENTEFIFRLPTANGANKTLDAWIKRAKIEKHIRWHNARHSFGTNLILSETDILTTSSLMGHATLRHTQRYVKAAEKLKDNAMKKMKLEI